LDEVGELNITLTDHVNCRLLIRGWLCALVIVRVAGATVGASSGSFAGEFGRSVPTVRAFIEKQRQQSKIPGIAIAIVSGDEIVLLDGFGLRDIEKKLPVTADTIFGIGSCTKAFTGMAAVMSVDDGKLLLEDSPKKYLPWFELKDPKADANVTLLDLLTHRTGLKAFDDEVWHKSDRLTREEVIKAVMLNPPVAKFRSEFHYNNVMYSAVGECIGVANGTSWDNFIINRIFRPLGMTRSGISLQKMKADADTAIGYHRPGTMPAREKEHDLANVAASGAIHSTARDMAQWIRLMIGQGVFEESQLISAAGWQRLLTPGIGNYTLGWTFLHQDGVKVLFSEGGAVGHAACVTINIDRKLGWVILANVNNVKEFREFADSVEKYLTTSEQGINRAILLGVCAIGSTLLMAAFIRSRRRQFS
jgi:CubicO group peptidase (beta-lactamase class C family)